MPKQNKTEANFSEDFQELEAIINWFEGDEVELEEGLSRFERGLELAQRCKERLDEVDNKVNEIRAKFDEGEPGVDEEDRAGEDGAAGRLL
jgi:exodeoxyribonuclease VII small subunit